MTHQIQSRFKTMPTSCFIALSLLIVMAVWLLGWFGKRQDWTITTGWNAIPAEYRPQPSKAMPDEPWIRWLGHSGFVIRWHGETLLLDPNLSDHCTVSKRIMNFPPDLTALGPAHALISHAHFDHLNQDTLVGLPELTTILIPSGSEIFLDRIDTNATHIRPVVEGTSYQLGELRITPVAAAHNGNRFHPLRSQFDAVGYMIQSPQGTTLYYAGDTAYANPWSVLRETYHPDIAILPIGAYAPRIPLKFHHINPEEAVKAATELGVRKVIPCHFGTFTLSFDRPSAALPRFARAIQGKPLRWEMPQFLQAGDLKTLEQDVARDRQKKHDHET
ncbi:MAG: MBL fold metallo-hydrolase [Kiritimatiellae bacterium]|nr:MBL fold metallo-hydrolase [Kiritimatiellia bacterium]